MESRIQNSESRRTSAKTFEDLIILGPTDRRQRNAGRLLGSHHRTILNSGF
ncbi:hypothetical protein GALL_161180 [mine drainage metagenome]|uniref:Uncharacterized protein n=1 Tax=mine drainage metagenome TaxID=410659 RepID=A0A1J5SCN9_9ZZZZ